MAWNMAEEQGLGWNMWGGVREVRVAARGGGGAGDDCSKELKNMRKFTPPHLLTPKP